LTIGQALEVLKERKRAGSTRSFNRIEQEKKGSVAPGTAEKRRELYNIRHAENRTKAGTPGYYAAKILWE